MFPLTDGETVDRLRAALVPDVYSGAHTGRDWAVADELPIEGCAIAPSSSFEQQADDRRAVITGMSLYCASGSDVLPDDRIRARSGLWEVDGEGLEWTNPFTGWSPGAEFRLRKVVG